MAVNLNPPGPLHPVRGVRLATARAGIRKQGRADVALIECSPGTVAAAVFTNNVFCAAPVLVAREHLCARRPRFLLVNSGNANAGTGAGGLRDAHASCERLAALAQVSPEEVLPFSTGVIGERLPLDRLEAGVEDAVSGLGRDNWLNAARAIMTTDTMPKAASLQVEISGELVTLTGIAKGAGMIRPDMATMLAFIATDAAVEETLLREMLREAVDRSFNRITVDGDTSTNDACVLLASGQSAAGRIESPESEGFEVLQSALEKICIQLAQSIVRDGEGATKFVAIEVTGAANSEDALKVAYTVAHSPLVKTALFAADPNWGRILAAVGRSGIANLEQDRLELRINDVLVASGGALADGYIEDQASREMQRDEIILAIDLGMGHAIETVWTTDLSHEYVSINADYRS